MGLGKPLVEARGSAKRGESTGVLVRGDLVERGDRITEGKNPSLPQGVEDLIHTRNSQLAEAADLVESLVFYDDPNAFRLLLLGLPPAGSSTERWSAGSDLPPGIGPRWPPLPWP